MTDLRIKVEPILVENICGEMLSGDLYRAPEQTKYLVIVCHGLGMNKDHRLMKGICETFSVRGVNAFTFSFSGYSPSQGKQQDSSFTKQAMDLCSVIDYFTYKHCKQNDAKEDEGRPLISVIGHSGGGTAAIRQAAFDRRIKSLLLNELFGIAVFIGVGIGIRVGIVGICAVFALSRGESTSTFQGILFSSKHSSAKLLAISKNLRQSPPIRLAVAFRVVQKDGLGKPGNGVTRDNIYPSIPLQQFQSGEKVRDFKGGGFRGVGTMGSVFSDRRAEFLAQGAGGSFSRIGGTHQVAPFLDCVGSF